jgi:hypothetical protein
MQRKQDPFILHHVYFIQNIKRLSFWWSTHRGSSRSLGRLVWRGGGGWRVGCLAGLLEDLALVELPALGIGALPLEVLGHQLFALVRGGVQLAPTKIQSMLKMIRLYEEKIIES